LAHFARPRGNKLSGFKRVIAIADSRSGRPTNKSECFALGGNRARSWEKAPLAYALSLIDPWNGFIRKSDKAFAPSAAYHRPPISESIRLIKPDNDLLFTLR